jgi:hypothetical protein
MIAAIFLAGCATVPAAEAEDVPAQGSKTPLCDSTKARGLIGRTVDAAVRSEARRLTGAAAVRVIGPGDMVTMEYREDRLNIDVDSRNKAVGFRCG